MKNNLPLFSVHADLYNLIDQYITKSQSKNLLLLSSVIPSIISQSDLEKLGYYKSFHGHLTEAVPICCPDERAVLIPAACLPVYPLVPELGLGDQFALTFSVPVYRFEEGKRSKFRFWEFHVREFVFIGKEDYVLDCLDKSEKAILAFCEKQGLSVTVEIGSDYFTGEDKEIKTLKRLQRANKLKREIVWTKGEEKVALASVNYHMTHFSKTYGWDKDGTIVSGCVGCGLERWLNVWLEEKGLVMPVEC